MKNKKGTSILMRISLLLGIMGAICLFFTGVGSAEFYVSLAVVAINAIVVLCAAIALRK